MPRSTFATPWGPLLASLLLTLGAPGAAAAARVAAISPIDGARYVRPETSILVRYDGPAGLGATPLEGLLTVTGSVSGVHAGLTRLARDGDALLFHPRSPFTLGERVTVTVAPAAAPEPGVLGSARTFAFEVASVLPAAPSGPDGPVAFPDLPPLPARSLRSPAERAGMLDALPGDFPRATATKTGITAPGYLLAANISFDGSIGPYLMILDDSGAPVWYRAMQNTCFDFRRQENGQFTYYDPTSADFVVLDSTMTPVDHWQCGNGYAADLHELRLLPNGHALLMANDPEVVNMSLVVPGGRTSATVIGLVIQELDADKQVVFQWRSWDHFQITDCIHQDLTKFSIDYVHGNALEVDRDGNVLLSSRHMSEITKIDRLTGDILWRWGGLHNQFTFLGDTLQFTYQHAIRRWPDGHVTLFDNGNWHTPPFSRACEYVLDEVHKTATLVWSYRNTPDEYGAAMGYVERLPNGNRLISWGLGKPDAIEVNGAGHKVFELSLGPSESSYRITRTPVNGLALLAGVGPSAPLGLSWLGPNPVHGPSVLLARLPVAGTAAVKVLDVQGRVVATPLPPAWHPAGVLPVRVSLAGRPAGVYFCRLQVGRRSAVRRLVLVN